MGLINALGSHTVTPALIFKELLFKKKKLGIFFPLPCNTCEELSFHGLKQTLPDTSPPKFSVAGAVVLTDMPPAPHLL